MTRHGNVAVIAFVGVSAKVGWIAWTAGVAFRHVYCGSRDVVGAPAVLALENCKGVVCTALRIACSV